MISVLSYLINYDSIINIVSTKYVILFEREGSSERSLKNEDGFSPGLLIEK